MYPTCVTCHLSCGCLGKKVEHLVASVYRSVGRWRLFVEERKRVVPDTSSPARIRYSGEFRGFMRYAP